jgi:hypothetical protein
MNAFIPHIINHCGDFLIAIFGLAAGLLYFFRPDWVGNYRVDRDRKKFRWLGFIFIVAGIGLLMALFIGYLNPN